VRRRVGRRFVGRGSEVRRRVGRRFVGRGSEVRRRAGRRFVGRGSEVRRRVGRRFVGRGSEVRRQVARLRGAVRQRLVLQLEVRIGGHLGEDHGVHCQANRHLPLRLALAQLMVGAVRAGRALRATQ
jgi:hypothetical protein